MDGIDFTPILPSKEEKLENTKDELEEIAEQIAEKSRNLVSKKEVLSIANLVNLTESHIRDDERCKKNINEIKDILDRNRDKFSIKELLDEYKILIKEREFHIECIFKAYNYITKTELAKQLLIGDSRNDRGIKNITDKSRINAVSKLLRDRCS